MKYPPIGSIVELKWRDAWVDIGETAPKDWVDEVVITTYGILLRTGKVVTLAAEELPGKEYRSAMHVPQGMVISVKKLR